MKLMSREISLRYFAELETSEQAETAVLISDLTHSQMCKNNKVAPLEPEDVMGKYLGLIATRDDEFAGFIGAEPRFKFKAYVMSKVGSLIVAEAHQQLGLGTILVHDMTQTLVNEGVVPFAFHNPASGFAFFKSGYIPAIRGDLPKNQVSLYDNQAVIRLPFNRENIAA